MLLAVAGEMGYEGEWIPRVASAFGGGIARTGQVCGAISGALMAIGWAKGRSSSDTARDEVYARGSELVGAFLERFPSTSCRILMDLDLADAGQRKLARERGVFKDRCSRLVEFCSGRAVETLCGEGPNGG